MMGHVRVKGMQGRPVRVNIGYVHAKKRREPLRPHGMDGSPPTAWLQTQTNYECARG